MRTVMMATVLVLAVPPSMLPRAAECPSALIKGTVAEMIDVDASSANLPVLSSYNLMFDDTDYPEETPAELCMRDAYVVLRDVEPIDPAYCKVPSELLVRVWGQRGWRVRLGKEWCKPVGPFFTSRWHVGDTLYALVYRPGTGAVLRCLVTRCIGAGEEGAGGAAPAGAGTDRRAEDEVPVSELHCDGRLTELTESLPQMCTLQENLILVLPLGKYMDPRLNEDKQ